MFERFTKHARTVLELEGIEAQQMHSQYLGTEHLLLALIAEPAGHGHRALAALGVNLQHARQALAKISQEGPRVKVPAGVYRTEHARNVMRATIDEARALKSPTIGTEHLLLALLRETDGVALHVLKKLNVKPQAVRDEILNMLAQEQPPMTTSDARTYFDLSDKLE
ncbi:MAG: hypothetical protein FWE88_08390 [Phycisphaerae bacterium]|nr:hypothetical protein [Phycisphaerae bacterium]